MATTFHRLTVRDVESLTDDSAAVTFDVPPLLTTLKGKCLMSFWTDLSLNF